ncbi:MAG: NADH-quinone oxidoreductase subunit J [Planctomycetes bacterium]|nr:NADH-quinone oxidoreductase subunit J [Planctomycetota bacterium]
MLRELFFVAASLLAILTALLTVTRKNPIYATFFLISHLISIAILISTLKLYYLSAIHILVYTGAIMILFLFVVMLLNLKEEELEKDFSIHLKLLYTLAPISVMVIIVGQLKPQDINLSKLSQLNVISFENATKALFDKYFLAFEIVSALIILAIIGSILIAKKKV